MPQASEMRQDQTLKWDEIFHPARQIVGRDPPQVIANQSIASPRSVAVKRRPPKSRPAASSEGLLPRKKAARKDSAVHVSLSSYSLVKQPGTRRSPLPAKPEKRSKLHASDLQSEALSLSSVWSFEGAPSRRQADG